MQPKIITKTMTRLQKNNDIPRVNLPALARKDLYFMSCFTAEPGYVFVSQDVVSLEPTITAHFSQDKYYKYATVDGVGKAPYIEEVTNTLMIDDIYLMTASRLPSTATVVLSYFSDKDNIIQWLKDSEVCKNDPVIKKARKYAKPACLGFNYGMGPRKFVSQSYDAGMYISLDEAKSMYKAYWDLFAGVKDLVSKLEKLVEKNNSIINPFGYRLTPESHKGYNAFIQSTASGVLDVFNLKFFNACPWAQFVALIHDETIYAIPEDKIQDTEIISIKCIKSLNETLNWSTNMRFGFKVGKTFADIK